MRSTRGSRAIAALGVTTVAGAVLLSGCGGGNSAATSKSAGDSARSAARPAADGGAVAGGKAAPEVGSSPRSIVDAKGLSLQARVVPGKRDIVYRGSITVRVKDVARAVTTVEDAATETGGIVAGENTSTDPSAPRRSSAHLTLRVPTQDFRGLMDSVAAVGKRVSQSQSAQDVTGQVVDTESRLATQKRSVARVRALLAEAKTIGQVVQVESELSRREADLESLEAQLAQLRDVADLATLEVELLGPTATPAKKKAEENLGFLAGLKGGLTALAAAVVVVLTVLGAVLPFAFAGALVGLPVWLILRSRLRRRVPPTVPVA